MDAGLAGNLTRGQLGQGAVVAPRQVAAHGACLGDHEVKVVEQPFGGGGHCLALVHVLRQQAIGCLLYTSSRPMPMLVGEVR